MPALMPRPPGARVAVDVDRGKAFSAAFAALAERLDALAKERAKPWWRRLVG